VGDSGIFDVVNLKILCNDILYTAQFFDIQSFNIDKEFIELRTVQVIDYPTGLYFILYLTQMSLMIKEILCEYYV